MENSNTLLGLKTLPKFGLLHSDVSPGSQERIPAQPQSAKAAANMQQERATAMSVKVGNTGYFSEFIIGGQECKAYVKRAFNPTKVHFNAIEHAIAQQQHQEQAKVTPRVTRTHISIAELLNPEV